MTSEKALEMVLSTPLNIIIKQFPICRDFFLNIRLCDIDWELPLDQALDEVDEMVLAEFDIDRAAVILDFLDFLEAFTKNTAKTNTLQTITIIGGHDKSGEPEISEFTISSGETISIVGPTGAGKSRLLADIECLADGDTPTGRKILADGKTLTEEERFHLEGKLVAQLSQNMNFVMDLTVQEFLEMHAESRLSENIGGIVDRAYECANALAGEKFARDAKVTQLSGGQSRALMIADTAYISASPIVLIDEIENAGIDRRQAVEILAKKEKIVLISTHDPLLALSTDKRIVIQNGGIRKIVKRSEEEKLCLQEIEKLDGIFSRLRSSLRKGEEIKMETMKGSD